MGEGNEMRRSRIGYALVLTAGLTGPIMLSGCGADEAAGPQTTTAPETTATQGIPTTARTASPPTTPRPVPETGPEPGFDRTAFSHSATVDNKFFPLRPGMRLSYRGQTIEDGERLTRSVIFIVTDLTKVIDGVRTRVVWERDLKAGALDEAELAFFAQADDGTVWHFGEYPEVFEEGKVVETPAWIHGQKGARAGIAMKAQPKLKERSYAQGWGPAVGWADRARIHQVGQRTCVPTGCFSGVIVTDEYNLTEPGAHQLKYFAAGVGNVRVGYFGNDPNKETLELTSAAPLSRAGLAEARAEALKMEKGAYVRSKDVYAKTAPMN